MKSVCRRRILEVTYPAFIKKKLAPSTIARKICATKHFFGFLESEGLIKGNPSLRIEAPKRSKMLPSALTEEEISKMFDTCYGDESKEGVRLSAMMGGFIFFRHEGK